MKAFPIAEMKPQATIIALCYSEQQLAPGNTYPVIALIR